MCDMADFAPMDPMAPYVARMEDVAWRLRLVAELLDTEATGTELQALVEGAAVQMRMILEEVALASLSANADLYRRAYADIAKMWDARKILSRVEEVNPRFYPTPNVATLSDKPGIKIELDGAVTGYLTRSEFPKAYGRLGALCHAPNPFAPPREYARARVEVLEIRSKVETLLAWHVVRLVGDDRLHLVRMKDPSGHPISVPLSKKADIPPEWQ